jgi:predicted permease
MQVSFSTILGAALPVFILLAAGYAFRRAKVLTAEADASLLKLIVQVLYPCLYLDYVIGNPALDNPVNLIAAPLVGFVTVAGGFALAFLLGRTFGLVSGKGLRTFAFGNGIYNYGFIPIPLILILFDDRGTLGVLLVHNVGVELAIWTVGVMLLAGKFKGGALGKLFNPPLLALVVALLINAAGWDAHIPGWFSRAIGMLAACCVPMGILLAGALIADLLQKQRLLQDAKVISGSLLVRLALLPAGFILLAAYLPWITPELRQVILVQAAMPAGIMPIVLARHYGGESGVAVRIVIATTLGSAITMPLWIHWGINFVMR